MATSLSLEPHYPDFFKPGAQLDSFVETFPVDPNPEVCPLYIDYNRVDIAPEVYFKYVYGFGDFQVPPALKSRIPKNRQYVIPSAASLISYAQSIGKNVTQLTQSDVNTFVDQNIDVTVGLFLDQFSESGLNEDSSQYEWYYQRIRYKIDAAYTAGTITTKPFVGGGYTGPSSPSSQSNRFTAPDSHTRNPLGKRFTDPTLNLPDYYDGNNSLQFCLYYKNSRQNFMGTNAGTYQASPGWVDDFYEWLNGVFIALLNKGKFTSAQQATSSLGFFNWEVTGDSRDAFATSWEVQTTNPSGRALTAQRIPISPPNMEAMGFIVGFFFDWAVLWDEGNKRIADVNAIDSYKDGYPAEEQSVTWFSAADPTTPHSGINAFPFVNSNYRYNRPKGPKRNRDFFYLGYRKGKAMRALYTQAQFSFVDYKLDTAAYVTAQTSGKEVLQAASGFRRIVMRFDDGTNFRFVDFNPYGDSLNHTLTAKRSDGTEYTFPIIDGLLNITAPVGTTMSGGTPATTPLAFDKPNFIYNSTTNKLIVAVTGAVGTPTFTIVGVIGNAVQPTDGFTITSNAIGTELTVRVKTPTQTEIETKYTATVTQSPATPASPTGVVPALPKVGIGLYVQSVDSRDFGNGLEDRSAYEYFGLRYIKNNDGVPIASVGPDKYLPPYLTQFYTTATEAGAQASELGAYITMPWSQFARATQAQYAANGFNAPWTADNLSPAHARLLVNLFADAKAKGMKLGLSIQPGREGEAKEYISVADQPRSHDGSLITGDVIVPAIRQFGRLKASGFDVNNINTTTTIGKFLLNLKNKLHTLQTNFADGSLAFIVPGTNPNYELGYPDYQNEPDTSWSDWHPDEIADLQTYLKTLYSNNLATLNSAWGTSFAQWTDVTFPYTGNFGDFQGQRGKDCLKFRHIRIGDAVELYCRTIWSELRGIPIILQFGQPFGGQSGIIGTVDITYFFQRALAVATELGITTPCIGGKFNPIPYENHRIRARWMAYRLQEVLGYVITQMEDSYDANDTPSLPYMTAINMSKNLFDTLRYGYMGRSGDNVTVFAVLFNPKSWLGVDANGNPSDAGNSVLSMFQQLFAKSNRNTPVFSFNQPSTTKSITVTLDQMLQGMGPGGYPWFAKLENDWGNLNGENEDVKLLTTGLGLSVS